jgi:hypothetical protein
VIADKLFMVSDVDVIDELVQDGSPIPRYWTLYPIAPLTAFQLSVAEVGVTPVVFKLDGVLHGGTGVEKFEDDEYDEVFELPQSVCTCHS